MKEKLLRHRGLSQEEIDYVLYDGPPAFNIYNKPVGGGDTRAFLLFYPSDGTYYMGSGEGPIYKLVDRHDYALIWEAYV
jgi:hypothetical protein